MSEKPTAGSTTDSALRRFREYTAAALATIVILGTVVMMVVALFHIDTSDRFGRIKDLLLLLNPLLGVIIGYYFNKVSTEARAESAEETAQNATLSAQQAIEARNAAETEARAAQSKAEEALSTLSEVSRAADDVLAQMPATPRTLGVDEEGRPTEDARLELRAALAHARRITGS